MSIAGDYLPDSPADWLFGMLKMVVWADNPVNQVAANLLLFIIALVSSSVTLGATLILASIFATFGTIGIARLVWMLVANWGSMG
jgi:hypothetical protein